MKGDRVECVINGAVVAGYNKAALVTAGKLKSLDGVYGLRFAHNTEVTVTGLTMTIMVSSTAASPCSTA